MTVGDHESVASVGFAAWRSSGTLDANFASPAVIEAARREFSIYPANAKGEVVVAEIDDCVVGWIAREDHPDHISDLWVDPGHQGRGIGSMLIEHVCARMASSGIKAARIDTHANNSGAIRLYERCGFQIVWRGEDYDQALAVILQKVHLKKVLR
ncbi:MULTISPECIES: GNAT family N-acetyltransferase [unclassified Sinorhizobium]|uniref:GNAT family N-acetyltransferase n=1 Tax=unclassified Sinorhizobium TaxID=2613772 RepID=UPI00352495CC